LINIGKSSAVGLLAYKQVKRSSTFSIFFSLCLYCQLKRKRGGGSSVKYLSLGGWGVGKEFQKKKKFGKK
jgi:hypothetical protein